MFPSYPPISTFWLFDCSKLFNVSTLCFSGHISTLRTFRLFVFLDCSTCRRFVFLDFSTFDVRFSALFDFLGLLNFSGLLTFRVSCHFPTFDFSRFSGHSPPVPAHRSSRPQPGPSPLQLMALLENEDETKVEKRQKLERSRSPGPSPL